MPTVAGKRDYYEVLGVARDATLDQIKRAYRQAAMKDHPDRNPGDQQAEARFKEAAEAYAVLADSDRRARYDRFGHDGLAGAGMGGFDPGVFSDFEDLFGGIFGEFFGFDPRSGRRGGASGAARRGADLRYDLEIDFEEAVLGSQTQIRVPRRDICGKCEGLGAATADDLESCTVCRGTGQQRFSQGFFTLARTCGRCRGAGRTIRKPCEECRGSGQVPAERTLKVSIPAGVEDGTRMRVQGEGDAGAAGGPHGDLYVDIRVREHTFYHRDGLDLVCTLPITISQAALGGSITFKGVHGSESVDWPAGTQSGAQIRIRGKGVSDLRGYARGDLIVGLAVRTPRKLSREGRKILKRLAESGADALPPEDRDLLERIK